jgi:hypothetical protein
MKKRLLSLSCAVIVFLYASSCIALSEAQKQDYASLKTAVVLSKLAVKGKFGHHIPPTFSAAEFLQAVKDRIPENSYDTLERYRLQVNPKDGYYLLAIFNPENNTLILFTYSCEPGIDGPVLEEPGKYDVNNLQLYDKCKQRY